MSKITTQEATKLLEDGWVLSTYKDNFFGHNVWLKNTKYNGPGCVKYITHGVYNNLLKLGYKPIIMTIPHTTGE